MNMTIDQILKKAMDSHTEGRLDEAEINYKKVLKLKPDYVDVHNNLGVALKTLGRLEEAETSFRKTIELDPNYSEAHYNLGVILHQLRKSKDAEESYKKAIQFKPDHAMSHNNLGIVLMSLRKEEEAEVSLKKAIQFKPDYADAHNNLSLVKRTLGKLDEAKDNVKKAIELEPENFNAYNNLGTILQDLGRFEEAEESYKKAIELKPDYADAYYNLGITLNNLERTDEAGINYKKAIKIQPNFISAYNNLGNIMHNLGRLDEAEECFHNILILKPGLRAALINRGKILFDKEEFEKSLKDFDAPNTELTRSFALSSLYYLGRINEIYQRIETNSELDERNLSVAAFSAFITEKEKKETAHKFCNNPMDFMYFSNLSSHIKDSNSFITEVIDDLQNVKTRWEPHGRTTRKGYHSDTSINIFNESLPKINSLKSIIIKEIDQFQEKFKDEKCLFIKKWPIEKNLFGWHVVLKQQGYQIAHIHPNAWLSGVIYLKVVPTLGKNEGAIEFSLDGENYSNPNAKKIKHQPKIGDIVLFPSTLHHRTIPFTTDTDRIIVSFDLMPM